MGSYSQPRHLSSFDSGEEKVLINGHVTPEQSPERENGVKEVVSEFVIPSDEPLVDSRKGKLQNLRYHFNQYEMPPSEAAAEGKELVKARLSALKTNVHEMDRQFTRFLARTVILLSRSSGRDKLAAFFQYGSMFWGHQSVFTVSQAPDASWRKLEDSMNSGRKVFRLFKWVKEYEKARIALTVPGEYLGILRTQVRIVLTRILTVLMHTWSGIYFFMDNIIWAAQIGIINRVKENVELNEFMKNKLSYEQYLEFQEDYVQVLKSKEIANQRIVKWKNWKNNASLCRLTFAICYSLMQIDSLSIELKRLNRVFKVRVGKAESRGDDSSSIIEDWEKRVYEVNEAIFVERRSVLQASCQLAMLLNRLKYTLFHRIPLWGVGLLGMIAACCGIHKNWPQEVPKQKRSKVVRSRCESIEKNGAHEGNE